MPETYLSGRRRKKFKLTKRESGETQLTSLCRAAFQLLSLDTAIIGRWCTWKCLGLPLYLKMMQFWRKSSVWAKIGAVKPGFKSLFAPCWLCDIGRIIFPFHKVKIVAHGLFERRQQGVKDITTYYQL